MLSEEFKAISKLKKLLAANCKIEKIHPAIFASDAEVNIVTVTMLCPDGKTQTIHAYREEAHVLREFIRTSTMHRWKQENILQIQRYNKIIVKYVTFITGLYNVKVKNGKFNDIK